ncbi:hypothetical protein SCA6_004909 [Theobroma cacao]
MLTSSINTWICVFSGQLIPFERLKRWTPLPGVIVDRCIITPNTQNHQGFTGFQKRKQYAERKKMRRSLLIRQGQQRPYRSEIEKEKQRIDRYSLRFSWGVDHFNHLVKPMLTLYDR